MPGHIQETRSERFPTNIIKGILVHTVNQYLHDQTNPDPSAMLITTIRRIPPDLLRDSLLEAYETRPPSREDAKGYFARVWLLGDELTESRVDTLRNKKRNDLLMSFATYKPSTITSEENSDKKRQDAALLAAKIFSEDELIQGLVAAYRDGYTDHETRLDAVEMIFAALTQSVKDNLPMQRRTRNEHLDMLSIDSDIRDIKYPEIVLQISAARRAMGQSKSYGDDMPDIIHLYLLSSALEQDYLPATNTLKTRLENIGNHVTVRALNRFIKRLPVDNEFGEDWGNLSRRIVREGQSSTLLAPSLIGKIADSEWSDNEESLTQICAGMALNPEIDGRIFLNLHMDQPTLEKVISRIIVAYNGTKFLEDNPGNNGRRAALLAVAARLVKSLPSQIKRDVLIDNISHILSHFHSQIRYTDWSAESESESAALLRTTRTNTP